MESAIEILEDEIKELWRQVHYLQSTFGRDQTETQVQLLWAKISQHEEAIQSLRRR